jgi:hypothetical protein
VPGDLLGLCDQTLPLNRGAGRLRLAEFGLKTRKRGRSRLLRCCRSSSAAFARNRNFGIV